MHTWASLSTQAGHLASASPRSLGGSPELPALPLRAAGVRSDLWEGQRGGGLESWAPPGLRSAPLQNRAAPSSLGFSCPASFREGMWCAIPAPCPLYPFSSEKTCQVVREPIVTCMSQPGRHGAARLPALLQRAGPGDLYWGAQGLPRRVEKGGGDGGDHATGLQEDKSHLRATTKPCTSSRDSSRAGEGGTAGLGAAQFLCKKLKENQRS